MFTYEQIQSLNDLELGVYNYVIKNMDAVGEMKIRDLADNAHVSTTTILNFCNKMGCRGYSEFKVKLQLLQEVEKTEQFSNDTLAMMEFLDKINTPDFISQIDASAELIVNSENVYFYGIGTSGILGQYGARYLSNMNVYSSYIGDPFYPVPDTKGRESVVIILSVSGETETVLGKVNEYKQNNFKVISITNSRSSTLSRMSDSTVSYYMPIEKTGRIHNITTQVPVVHIIESLARRAFQLKNKHNNE